MKYLSVFVTIVTVWIAILITTSVSSGSGDHFSLYVLGMICTLVLFVIGFGRKS